MKRTPLAICLALGLLAAPALAQDDEGLVKRTTPWDGEILSLAAKLPIQDGGRVKPLSTYAGFLLLRLRGVRAAYTPEPNKEKLTPTAWILDCLFFPEQAEEYEVFLIQNSDVLTSIGLGEAAKRKRDRYSFAELEPGLTRLFQKQREIGMSKPESKDWTPVEAQTMGLARNVQDFIGLSRSLSFTRHPLRVDTSPGLQIVFENAETLPFSKVLAGGPKVTYLFQEIQTRKGLARDRVAREVQAIQTLARRVEGLSQHSNQLAILPPSESFEDEKTWMSPLDLARESFQTQRKLDRQRDALTALEEMEAGKTDPKAFKAGLEKLHKGLKDIASDREQYWKIPWEVVFYRCDFFYRALLCFLIAFLLTAASWMINAKWLTKAVWGFNLLAIVLLVTGIVFRCVLRGRPPVSTLYETILFIASTGVITLLIIEAITRIRLALSLSSVLGAAGMFLAYKYELRPDGGDTMNSLVAVLDTNFWLSTHVTTVTLGYSAGLLASALGHVYLGGKMLGLGKDNKEFYRIVGRLAYGVLCFGLLFSIVGTILGGIWANYSWGRFWGWDPKENGALLIILWELMILHARLGGYIRDWGVCALSILGGMVVVFSWWGVNLLGVGLHSYGFTDGVATILMAFYIVEALFVLIGGAFHLGTQNAIAAAKESVLEDVGAKTEAPPPDEAKADETFELTESAQAEVAAEAEPATEAEPAAEAEAEPEAEAKTEPATDAEAESQPEAEPEAEAGPEAEAEAEPEPEAETDTKS